MPHIREAIIDILPRVLDLLAVRDSERLIEGGGVAEQQKTLSTRFVRDVGTRDLHTKDSYLLANTVDS